MPTSSITKKFEIKDNETYEKLAEVLNNPTRRKKKPSTNKYEEGKKILKQLYPK